MFNIMKIFSKKEAPVLCSLDYVDDLKKAITLLEERVHRLELKSQLTSSGQLKVLQPTPTPIKRTPTGRKPRCKPLTSDTILKIEYEFMNGVDRDEICKRYDISQGTYWRIITKRRK